jgi:hypothetical protein
MLALGLVDSFVDKILNITSIVFAYVLYEALHKFMYLENCGRIYLIVAICEILFSVLLYVLTKKEMLRRDFKYNRFLALFVFYLVLAEIFVPLFIE